MFIDLLSFDSSFWRYLFFPTCFLPRLFVPWCNLLSTTFYDVIIVSWWSLFEPVFFDIVSFDTLVSGFFVLLFLFPDMVVSWYVCYWIIETLFFWYVCVPDIYVSWYFFENRFDLLISDVASHVHITFFWSRNRFKKEAAIFSADLSRVAAGWTWYKRCKPLQLKVQAKGGKGCFNQFKVVTAICQEAFSIHKLTHPYQQVHQI